MTHPENIPGDRILRTIEHVATASDCAYSLVQELAFMLHELAPLTGGPLEPQNVADKAYAHVIVASGAAHRITRDIAAIAAAFDEVLAADADSPILLTLVGGKS